MRICQLLQGHLRESKVQSRTRFGQDSLIVLDGYTYTPASTYFEPIIIRSGLKIGIGQFLRPNDVCGRPVATSNICFNVYASCRFDSHIKVAVFSYRASSGRSSEWVGGIGCNFSGRAT